MTRSKIDIETLIYFSFTVKTSLNRTERTQFDKVVFVGLKQKTNHYGRVLHSDVTILRGEIGREGGGNKGQQEGR